MAKTFGELILEYQNYEYSKENYELTKECYELQLMNQYIESQLFMMENMDDIRDDYQEFNESYFVESLSDDSLYAMMESSKKKSDNIFKRIWKGIVKIWESIKTFFAKLFGKYEEDAKNANDVEKAIEELEFVEEDAQGQEDNKEDGNNVVANVKKGKAKKVNINKIEKLLKDSWKNKDFIIAAKQPAASKIKNPTLNGKDKTEVKNMLSAATSTEIIIRPASDVKIMSIEDIIIVFEKITNKGISQIEYNNKNNDPHKIPSRNRINELMNTFRDAKKYMDDSITKAAANGITIKLDKDKINDTVNKINQIYSSIGKIMSSALQESYDNNTDFELFIEENSDTGKIENYSKEEAEFNNIMKEMLTNFHVVTGNLMKIYNDLRTYRYRVVNAFRPIVQNMGDLSDL